MIQREISRRNQVRAAKSGENQAQASKCPLPVELHRIYLILVFTKCSNRCELQSIREVHLSIKFQSFYWGLITQAYCLQRITLNFIIYTNYLDIDPVWFKEAPSVQKTFYELKHSKTLMSSSWIRSIDENRLFWEFARFEQLTLFKSTISYSIYLPGFCPRLSDTKTIVFF